MHGCPGYPEPCNNITSYACTGRNVGGDCPPVCEFVVDAPEESLLCDECYETWADDREREQRMDALDDLTPTAGVAMMTKRGEG